LAGWPTRRSPSSVKATIDGVVRAPSAFSMTLGVLALHHGDAGIGRAEVDADDFCHGALSRARSEFGALGLSKERSFTYWASTLSVGAAPLPLLAASFGSLAIVRSSQSVCFRPESR
jgi:hypothetical protein